MLNYQEEIYIRRKTKSLIYCCDGGGGEIFWKDLSDITRQFIYKYCRCPICKKRINKDFSRCCNMNKGDCNGIPYIIAKTRPKEMELYLRKDKKKKYEFNKKYNRKIRVRSGGKLCTKKEIECLWNIQKGRCYYCGIEINNTEKKNVFNRDHLIPLSYDGTNDIRNIVLTCGHCNIKKHEKSEAEFWKVLTKEAGTIGEWDFPKINGVSLENAIAIWKELRNRGFLVQYYYGKSIWESKAVITEKSRPTNINRLLKFKNISTSQHEKIKKMLMEAYYRKCKVLEQRNIAKSIKKAKRKTFKNPSRLHQPTVS